MAKMARPVDPAPAEKVEITVRRIATAGKLVFRPDRTYRVKPEIRDRLKADGVLAE